jgi:hypothetical protein
MISIRLHNVSILDMLQCLNGSLEGHIIDFQQHFKAVLRASSPEPRPFYVHMTSIIVSPACFGVGTMSNLAI